MTDSAIKYVGVDGCKEGWIGIGLADDGYSKVEVCEEFADIVACFQDACVILVDIPIGLPEDGKPVFRVCDKEARGLLGKLQSSVFLVPSGRFVNEVMENEDWGYCKVKKMKYSERYRNANEWSNNRYGKGIGSQSFGIIPKIGEVDKFLRTRDVDSPEIREVHPEVCFWALNKALEEERRLVSKHEALGFGQRLRIVRCWVPNAVDIFEEVPRRENSESPLVKPDDVLDALAIAITAKIGSQKGNELRTLPKDPQPDSVGEMVYALIPKGTPC